MAQRLTAQETPMEWTRCFWLSKAAQSVLRSFSWKKSAGVNSAATTPFKEQQFGFVRGEEGADK
jgi:hypothetical protein